jgi:N-methylhydantoinase B
MSLENDVFTIDLREMPKQIKQPYNLSYDATKVTCQALFKMLTSGSSNVSNDGAFRCLEILVTEGTIVCPTLPAP